MTIAPPLIFDRAAVKRNRMRSARHGAQANFLFEDVASRLAERRFDINRPLDQAAILGGRGLLTVEDLGVGTLLDLDSAALLLPGGGAVCDEEALPLAEGRFDAVFSLLNLHTVNDLPGTLIQINRALKPDGIFIAAMFAAGTLNSLKNALLVADLETSGGAHPRVAPFVDVRDAGGLLQRAGFQMPVADTETITVNYSDPLRLFEDLRMMGETNVLIERARTFLSRTALAKCIEALEETRSPAGKIPIAFEVAFLTGWAPGPNQPRPLRPGSAKTRLAEALGTNETRLPPV